MAEVPFRAGLAALAEEAARLAPVAHIGFVQHLDDTRALLLSATRHGIVQCTVPSSDLPDLLRPAGADVRRAAADDRGPDGPIGWFLRRAGARQFVSVVIPEHETPARFWLASPRSETFTAEEISGFRGAAASAARLLNRRLPPDAARERLERLEQAGELLPALLRPLDVPAVLDRVSAVARQCLPHDRVLLRLFNDDLTECRSFAPGNAAGHDPPPPRAVTPALARALDFELVDDHREHPHGIDGPAAESGARSSLTFAVRFDDRVIGHLTFASSEPGRFSSADVAIGRRLADHAAVALSHYRLAEEGRRATVLQERAINLEVLDGLLATLTGVLDVREVFDRVSEIAQKVLPHDAMSISELIENGEKVRIHASDGLGELDEPFDMVMPDPTMARESWDYRLLADVHDHPEYARGPGWAAGMRSMLFVSIRMEGRNWGGLNFYSRTVGHFVHDDVLVARRITDHVALALSHRRLADEARRNEELRARTTSLELLDQLLAAMTDAGEVSETFDRISAIAGKVLAHDGLCLVVVLPDGERAIRYVNAGYDAGPASATVPVIEVFKTQVIDHEIVDDLGQSNAPHDVIPFQFGFRSTLRVPIWFDGRLAADLSFLSRSPAAYATPDVLIARRIADRIALSLRRERGLKAALRADEADARATRLASRVQALTEELDARTGYRRVIGRSASWTQVLTQATQVAATETTVLLLGESGTGKEVVARFLHRGSSRRDGPFVALNCAALPEQLLEAELFGYERGAYTGATQSKPGQLEQAAGGVLFLDEVGEMSLTAQPKFLRVLQEREFQRLGGTRVLRSDARIVAATNRDLPRSIVNGQFREDLYYRLNVFAIRLPPLRERRDDILELSEAFIAEIGRGLGRPPAGISRDAREMLVEYAWPGNVRELRNVLERAAILCDGGLITADSLALNLTPSSPPRPRDSASSKPLESPPGEGPLPAASAGNGAAAAAAAPVDGDLNSMERVMIERALQNAKFNKSKAARALGLTRHQLYIRMRRHGLD